MKAAKDFFHRLRSKIRSKCFDVLVHIDHMCHPSYLIALEPKRIEYILEGHLLEKSVKRPFCFTVSILQVYFTSNLNYFIFALRNFLLALACFLDLAYFLFALICFLLAHNGFYFVLICSIFTLVWFFFGLNCFLFALVYFLFAVPSFLFALVFFYLF